MWNVPRKHSRVLCPAAAHTWVSANVWHRTSQLTCAPWRVPHISWRSSRTRTYGPHSRAPVTCTALIKHALPDPTWADCTWPTRDFSDCAPLTHILHGVSICWLFWLFIYLNVWSSNICQNPSYNQNILGRWYLCQSRPIDGQSLPRENFHNLLSRILFVRLIFHFSFQTLLWDDNTLLVWYSRQSNLSGRVLGAINPGPNLLRRTNKFDHETRDNHDCIYQRDPIYLIHFF